MTMRYTNRRLPLSLPNPGSPGRIVVCVSVLSRYTTPDVKLGKFKVESMATTAVFYISCFQYLMLAFVLSKGPPYRRRIWTNGSAVIIFKFLNCVKRYFESKRVYDFYEFCEFGENMHGNLKA